MQLLHSCALARVLVLRHLSRKANQDIASQQIVFGDQKALNSSSAFVDRSMDAAKG